jgi:hypothetical protein
MNSMTSSAAKPAPSSQRPRYYARQVVTADDLNLEQLYFREKLRRHNRFLHGFGVVCGAQVIAATDPYMVTVKCGYLISPYGDEIMIPHDIPFDVRTQCAMPPDPPDGSDPWCQEPKQPPPAGDTFIAVRYKEKKDRLVRAPAGGCSCEVDGCEFTRWTDGYEICVIDHCPDSHINPPKFEDLFQGHAPDCAACPTEPWVVIAKVTVDDAGKVTVSQCACRRQIASLAGFWWACQNSDNNT